MEGRIRVSVVATGIDASQAKLEVPVARRSMAAPLPLTRRSAGSSRVRPRVRRRSQWRCRAG